MMLEIFHAILMKPISLVMWHYMSGRDQEDDSRYLLGQSDSGHFLILLIE